MLVFDLRTLASTAATVDDVLEPTDPIWASQPSPPAGAIRVTGRLSAAGLGRFYFSGQIAGPARDQCRRCLTDVKVDVAERVQWLFAETGSDDVDDDPDVYLFDPRARELDLRPGVREQWLLSVPAFVQCRDDCAGLCPTCGTDLNAGACGCEPAGDERWAALRSPASRSGAGEAS